MGIAVLQGFRISLLYRNSSLQWIRTLAALLQGPATSLGAHQNDLCTGWRLFLPLHTGAGTVTLNFFEVLYLEGPVKLKQQLST